MSVTVSLSALSFTWLGHSPHICFMTFRVPCGVWSGTRIKRLSASFWRPYFVALRHRTRFRPHMPCWLNGRSENLSLSLYTGHCSSHHTSSHPTCHHSCSLPCLQGNTSAPSVCMALRKLGICPMKIYPSLLGAIKADQGDMNDTDLVSCICGVGYQNVTQLVQVFMHSRRTKYSRSQR